MIFAIECEKIIEFGYVENKVQSALARLYIEDFVLLVRDVNERSISHKLTEYFQSEFNQLGIRRL